MKLDPSTAFLARVASRTVAIAGLLMAGSRAEAGVIADWFASRTTATDVSTSNSDLATDKTLFSRWMSRVKTPFSSGLLGDSPTLVGQRAWERTKAVSDAVSESELSAALKLVDAGKLEDAERLLKVIAARETKKVTPYGEKAQYWLAETQFRLQKYVKAHENFEILIKKYPGLDTEHVNKMVAREFQIAQIWLAHEDPKAKPLDWKSHFDGRAPLVDTNSFAVKALEHVRINDPTGPLADDAVLRMADHYHRSGDFDSAATYYDELINDPEHRKSEYRERALLSSIDSKIKGYIGPEYDVAGLEQAQDTITKVFTEYPEQRATSEGLYHTSDLIKDQYAERAYTVAMYYLKIKKAAAAEYYFGMVIAKWPDSKWAGESRKEMLKVAKMPRKASLPSKIMTMPGAPDPSTMGGNGGNNGSAGGAMGGLMNSMGGGGMGGMGGGGMPN
jgi:outer membrane protein assembly factor BamD (BamD/ComL family)